MGFENIKNEPSSKLDQMAAGIPEFRNRDVIFKELGEVRSQIGELRSLDSRTLDQDTQLAELELKQLDLENESKSAPVEQVNNDIWTGGYDR